MLSDRGNRAQRIRGMVVAGQPGASARVYASLFPRRPIRSLPPPMSVRLLRVAVPRISRRVHCRTEQLSTVASSARGASAKKPADNLQALIREHLNNVSHALADITAYTDWNVVEREITELKAGLEVRSLTTRCIRQRLT